MTPAGEAFTITGSAAIEPAAEDGGQKIAVTFTFHSSSGHTVTTATSAPLAVDRSNFRDEDIQDLVYSVGFVLAERLPELLTNVAPLVLGGMIDVFGGPPYNKAETSRAFRRTQKNLRRLAGHKTRPGPKIRTTISLVQVGQAVRKSSRPTKERKDAVAVRLGISKSTLDRLLARKRLTWKEFKKRTILGRVS